MGELAALLTSVLWSFTSLQFTLAAQRIGSAPVNRARLVVAMVFLALTHTVVYGAPWPSADLYHWGWLGLSGFIGLVLGDACLFQAFVLIGTRRSMLLMTLVPVIGALTAWLWLGESLSGLQIGAVLLTMGGIAWVVSERGANSTAAAAERRQYALGVLLGLGGALGQALGLVASKQGMAGDFSPLSTALIRMTVAVVTIWLLTLIGGRARSTWQALHDRRAVLFLTGGAFCGPFLGVWMSMVAVQNASVGVASALMALSPILLIPLDRWFLRGRITARSVVGTVIALSGAVALLLI